MRTEPAPLQPTLAALGGGPAARHRRRLPRPGNGSQVPARCVQPLARRAAGRGPSERCCVQRARLCRSEPGHCVACGHAAHGAWDDPSAPGSHLPSFQQRLQVVLTARSVSKYFGGGDVHRLMEKGHVHSCRSPISAPCTFPGCCVHPVLEDSETPALRAPTSPGAGQDPEERVAGAVGKQRRHLSSPHHSRIAALRWSW